MTDSVDGPRAVIVGAGISGIACAASLAEAGVRVEVRERANGLGGRMASRTLRGSGTPFDGRVVDIGASYFTATDPAFVAFVDGLVERGVVRPWTTAFHVAGPTGIEGVSTGPMRYAAPGGLRSIVAAMAEELDGPVIRTQAEVARVTITSDGPSVDDEILDAVALCLPLPQARRIADFVPDVVVPWEPVIAVTCVFDERTWVELDGVFVNDDAVLTWIADDGSRRGDDAPVLVAHVNPVLSARHLDDPTSVIPAVVATLQRVLRITAYPSWVDAHRWTFAKPLVGAEEPWWMAEGSLVGLAGDAWAGGPKVESAWLSGRALGQALGEALPARL